ncbi:hypothetical protein L6R50_25360 [Myxococcota bacterium]|nr:hypothetical protein [Myxococcota bacterium]
MNEHELQGRLTERWTAEGLQIDGRRYFLVAWEVMSPSWRINDAGKHWAEPSADFLVVDEQMRFTVVELKRSITGVKPCWLVLSQVTHRAVELARTITQAKLEQAYSACWSGAHGRVHGPKSLLPLAEHHRQFFGLAACVQVGAGPREFHRCVAAQDFGRAWTSVVREFNRLDGNALLARVRSELTSKGAEREVNRLTAISAGDLDRLRSPVTSLEVVSPMPC